jgi:hypothetical protein
VHSVPLLAGMLPCSPHHSSSDHCFVNALTTACTALGADAATRCTSAGSCCTLQHRRTAEEDQTPPPAVGMYRLAALCTAEDL